MADEKETQEEYDEWFEAYIDWIVEQAIDRNSNPDYELPEDYS